MMKLAAAVLLLALCFLPHRVVAKQTPCVKKYAALKAAIEASPTTTNDVDPDGADPYVIELCKGTIDFSKGGGVIDVTDHRFDLICPKSKTCTLDGGGSMQLFKAGNSSTPSSHEVTFQNIDFFQGHASGLGGAFEVYGGITELDGCVFDSNTAEFLGGAFYGIKFDLVAITQCSFENNEASHGGAIHVHGFSADILIIDDSTFTSNSANYGGAIFSEGPTTRITATTFSENSANTGVADIFIYDGFVKCDYPSNIFCKGYGTNYESEASVPEDLCGNETGPGATYVVGGCP